MAKQPGLMRRKARWYLRAKVPTDLIAFLGRDEIWRSLRTGDHAAAVKRFRRARADLDRLLALNRPDLAQPLGGRLAVAEATVMDLVAVVAGTAPFAAEVALSAHAVNATRCTRAKPSTTRNLMAARNRVALGVILEMTGRGEKNHTAMARALDARGLPAPRGGTWSGSQVKALLQRAALAVGREAAIRSVRTRTRPSVPTVPNRDIVAANGVPRVSTPHG